MGEARFWNIYPRQYLQYAIQPGPQTREFPVQWAPDQRNSIRCIIHNIQTRNTLGKFLSQICSTASWTRYLPIQGPLGHRSHIIYSVIYT